MPNHDQRNGESAVTYEISSGESLSEGVIEAIATVSDSDQVFNTPSGTGQALDPLYSVVDPEALDSIFRTADPDKPQTCGHVTFPYHGYEVTVRSEGRISVERREPVSGEAAD